jgi:hypothetical protein
MEHPEPVEGRSGRGVRIPRTTAVDRPRESKDGLWSTALRYGLPIPAYSSLTAL